MKRIQSEHFYVAERDENAAGEPTCQIVSKTEKHSFIFVAKKQHGNHPDGSPWESEFWVLIAGENTKRHTRYAEIRELVNRVPIPQRHPRGSVTPITQQQQPAAV
jgi:hypothetical protein